MNNTFTIKNLSAAPGTKVSGYVAVEDTDYTMPVTIINGANDGKSILVSAGIHGCEYPGILAVTELAKEIDPMQVSGAILFVHAVNMSGFLERQPFVVPADEERKNLNRLFPTDESGSLADKICICLSENFVKGRDFHIDLHSGDMVEDLEDFVVVANIPDTEKKAFLTEAAKRTGFKWRMNSGGKREFYNSSAIVYGVPSLLFERGGAGQCLRSDVDNSKQDVISIMKYLGILSGDSQINTEQRFFDRHEWTETETGDEGLLIPFVKIGDDITEGQKLFEICDMFGTKIREIHAKFDGHVVLMSRSLSVHYGDDLITYGHIMETKE